jgi:hypothetical protein
VNAFVAAGAGFLLAVLWFDLMFDVQTISHPSVPEEVLGSISGYYRRVTTEARPMNRLVAAVMLGTISAIGAEIVTSDAPAWVGWTSLVFVLGAVGLAGVRTVPAAVRLGSRADPVDRQRVLARAICRDHLACLLAILTVVVVQLGFT